jgi:hypothetical protein
MPQAVVCLLRGVGVGGGLESARNFFRSYHANPAGLPHDLVLLLKGWDGVAGRDEVLAKAQQISALVIELPDDGFDWGAYMRAAAQLPHDWLCFLNTHSRILAADWLGKLRDAAEQPGVAAAGATGSFGSVLPNLGLLGARFADVRERRGYAMAGAAVLRMVAGYPNGMARLLPDFRRPPNPHLRSNAFTVRRADFLAFAAANRIPATKREALSLENGRNSFTAFLEKSGRRTAVAGADGRAYPPESWPESGTFWVPGQPNLLVADNQTEAYREAGPHRRRFLEKAAWDRVFTPGPIAG